jgi:alpha-glucosidase
MDIRKIIYVFRAIRLSGIIRTIQYGFLRDRYERQFSTKLQPPSKIFPGNLKSPAPIVSGLRLEFEHARLEIVFLTQNLVRLSWEPGKSPIPYTIAKTDWKPQNVEIIHTSSGYSMICGDIDLMIDNSGGILVQDLNNNVLRKDNPPYREGDGWRLSTILGPEEHIYGLGERAGSFNLRPGAYCSWNTDPSGSYSTGRDPLYIGTPIYLSLSDSGSYLIYFENSYPSVFNIRHTYEASFSGGMLRYYIIFGSLQTIFSQLAELVGPPAMPPRWVFGYHQSRWGYRSEADIREVAEGFEEHDFPLSVIHLDIDYMDQFRIFTINSSLFPEMKKLSRDLKKKGIKLVASINPAVKFDSNYGVYADGFSTNAYCKHPNGDILHGLSWPGWSVFPDFTQKNAREWWKAQYKELLDEGIAGIWHDMNEPVSFAAWGDKSFPVSTQHGMEGRGGDHLEAHNLYGLLMNKAGYEALQHHTPDKRPWLISRSGWAGLQRYAWNWTGDIETSWEALRQTIPTILGLGLSGHAFSGVDIGGFSGSPSAELYLRWFQMATFLPFFRTHSAIGTKPREPWVFGELFTSIVRKFLKLRYRLIPYLYSLAWKTTQTGYPPIRPIFWENPQDHKLWDIEDEFILGESLLIAPIMDEKVTNREITLPAGIWYSIWDDQKYIGPTGVDYPVCLETIPIFVKGGTIIPMDENREICFHVFPGECESSSCQIYNDSGDGYGPWRIDNFQLNNKLDSMEIFWEFEGEYPFNFTSFMIQAHGKRLVHAICDGIPCKIETNHIMAPRFRTLNLLFE